MYIVVHITELDDPIPVEIEHALAEPVGEYRREDAGMVSCVGVERELRGPGARDNKASSTTQRRREIAPLNAPAWQQSMMMTVLPAAESSSRSKTIPCLPRTTAEDAFRVSRAQQCRVLVESRSASGL
jgi:hypothetical protein